MPQMKNKFSEILLHAREHFVDVSSLDTRGLAVFRIAIGMAQIYNVIQRMVSAELFLSDKGWFPRSDALTWLNSWEISIFLLTGNYHFIIALLTLHLGIAACFLVGHKTSIMTVLSFILTTHLNKRSIVITSGAEGVLKACLFFASFLPVSEVFSVDAALRLSKRIRSGRSASREGYSTRVGRRVWSWGTVGLVVQFFNIYLTAVTLKLKDKNWLHGIATFNTISLPTIARPIARCLTEYPGVCRLLTWVTLLVEAGMPMAWMLLPAQWKYTKRMRIFLIVAPLGMHVVMHFTLSVAWFQLIIIAPLLAMMPSEFWDWVWLRFVSSNPESLALRAPPPALHTNTGETRLLTLAGTFLACHPNHIADVVAVTSSTQQYFSLQQHRENVDQSAAARLDSVAVDVSTELPAHAPSDAEEERHPAPRGVRMRMGEAFSRLCHYSVPLGPFVVAYGENIAAPLRMVSRKSPCAQRALNGLVSVVGSPLQSRVCKALEDLDVPDEVTEAPPRPRRSCAQWLREECCNRSLLALFMIMCITTSNVLDVEKRTEFHPLFEIMQTSALSQSWHMFSPVPTTEDQWWVMAARLHDKSSIDLFKEPGIPGYWQIAVPWTAYLTDFLGLTNGSVNATKARNYMQAVAHSDNRLSWRRPETMWYRQGAKHHIAKWFERYAKFEQAMQDHMMKWYCRTYNQGFLPEGKRVDYMQLMKMNQRLPPPLDPGDWWMEETRKAQIELFGELSPDVEAHFRAKGQEHSRHGKSKRTSTAQYQMDLNVVFRVAQLKFSNADVVYLGDFDNVYECEQACWDYNLPQNKKKSGFIGVPDKPQKQGEVGHCYSFAYHTPEFSVKKWRRGCYGTKHNDWKPVKDEGVISGSFSGRQIQILHKSYTTEESLLDPMWWWMPEQPWRSNEASYGRPEPYTVLTWHCFEGADDREYTPLLTNDELHDMNKGFLTRGQPNAPDLPPPRRPAKDTAQHHFDHLVNRKPMHLQRTLFCLLAAPQEDPPIYFLLLVVVLAVLWVVATAGGKPLCAPLTAGTQSAARGVELTDLVASRDDELDDKNV